MNQIAERSVKSNWDENLNNKFVARNFFENVLTNDSHPRL